MQLPTGKAVVGCARLRVVLRGLNAFIDPRPQAPAQAGAQPEPHNAIPMHRRDLLRLTLLACAAALMPGHAPAAVLEGVRFEDRITLAGRELVLNGTGLRAAGWFKLYVAALYLPTRAVSGEAALAQAGPKRVRVVMLREAPAVELAKAVDKGVMRNASATEQAALRERLDQLAAQMRAVGDVKANDTIDFDLDPMRGTSMLLNGKLRGAALPGVDFYAAFLRSFIGAQPFHRDLRAGLLGTAPPK